MRYFFYEMFFKIIGVKIKGAKLDTRMGLGLMIMVWISFAIINLSKVYKNRATFLCNFWSSLHQKMEKNGDEKNSGQWSGSTIALWTEPRQRYLFVNIKILQRFKTAAAASLVSWTISQIGEIFKSSKFQFLTNWSQLLRNKLSKSVR